MVYFDLVIALVRDLREGVEIVVESVRRIIRERIQGIKECQRGWVDPIRRNLIQPRGGLREVLTCHGIFDGGCKESIALLGRGSGSLQSAALVRYHPLLTPEEEGLLSAVVDLRNPNGSAQCVAKDVLLQGWNGLTEKITGIQILIAEVFESAAMPGSAPALRLQQHNRGAHQA